ncbi:MAG: ElyC/SanA/YdcF family protein [Spiribacter sp.]|jgi:uncharacterized SAM-binding protein YcdF (DUF218 family)|nr:ElyC/SanA/YdcF family protein [Spiribacter sp.]
MFFFTKLAGALLKPLSLVLFGLAIGLIIAGLTRYRRTGLTLIGLSTLTLALISWWPVANTLISPLESRTPALPTNVPAIIVLGGGGVNAPSLPLTAQLSSSSVTRLTEGIRLWRQRPDALLITSGALSRGRSQAAIAADLAKQLGVPAAQIKMLPTARNTEDEARAYRALHRDEVTSADATPDTIDTARPILVTSASHMPRALAAFRKMGIDPIPAPTAYRATPRYFDLPSDFAPSATDLQTTEAAWHEYLGRFWAWIRQ